MIFWIVFLLAVGLGVWVLSSLYPQSLFSQDNQIQILRLIGILALVSSGLIYFRGIRLGETLRNISLWTSISAILMLGYTYQSELYGVYIRLASELLPGKVIVSNNQTLVLTKSADGHFYAFAKANGVKLNFMIDTGATNIVLSPRDAKRIGINFNMLRFIEKYSTANGIGYGAPYRLGSLEIKNFKISDVKISINQQDMETSLLGMSFLNHFFSFEIRKRKLFLQF